MEEAAHAWSDVGQCARARGEDGSATEAFYKAIMFGDVNVRIEAYEQLSELGVRQKLPAKQGGGSYSLDTTTKRVQ